MWPAKALHDEDFDNKMFSNSVTVYFYMHLQEWQIQRHLKLLDEIQVACGGSKMTEEERQKEIEKKCTVSQEVVYDGELMQPLFGSKRSSIPRREGDPAAGTLLDLDRSAAPSRA